MVMPHQDDKITQIQALLEMKEAEDNISIHKADETEPVHLIPWISRGKRK